MARRAPTGCSLHLRGRPRKRIAKSVVSTWLPIATHDQLIVRARAARKSVSALLREIIARDFSS